jgi:hypothetical protein
VLRKHTLWTAQFLGVAVINPLAPNKNWDDLASKGSILETEPAEAEI